MAGLQTRTSRHGLVKQAQAVSVARKYGAALAVMTAVEPFHVLTTTAASLSDTRESYAKHAKAEAERVLAEAQKKAKELGVTCAVVQVEADQPYKAIIEAADKNGCDLIAMASHGRRGMAALIVELHGLRSLLRARGDRAHAEHHDRAGAGVPRPGAAAGGRDPADAP